MKVSGSATVGAPIPVVWAALQDPAVLVRTIPGCLRLETIGADTYEMTVTAGVASIKGTYVGEVALTDPEPLRSFVLRARGQGAPGTVDATVRVFLSERGTGGESGTAIDYDADAVVGGMIGGVGQRMLGTVARRTAAEFFAAVEHALAESGPAPEAAAAAVTEPFPEPGGAAGGEATKEATGVESGEAAGRPVPARPVAPAGTVYTAPGPAARTRFPAIATEGGAGTRAMLAAFGAGGSVALAGVAVGYLLARRTRR